MAAGWAGDRVGWRLARAGAPGSAIMHEGRWSSSALVAKYTPRGGGGRRPPVAAMRDSQSSQPLRQCAVLIGRD